MLLRSLRCGGAEAVGIGSRLRHRASLISLWGRKEGVLVLGSDIAVGARGTTFVRHTVTRASRTRRKPRPPPPSLLNNYIHCAWAAHNDLWSKGHPHRIKKDLV